MILVDSSAWIEFIRKTGSTVGRRVHELVASNFVVVTQPVEMEVLSGARAGSHEAHLRTILGRHDLIAFDADVDFDGAARITRACRTRGITVGHVDSMIAAVAIRHRTPLLANDLDFARMASVVPLRLDPATPRS